MSDPCDKGPLLTILQVKQAEIAGDITHIKARIDNGMSTSIKNIEEKLTSLAPVIEHHADIVKRVEDFGWLISRWAAVTLLTAIFGMIVWALSKGWKI